MNTCGVLARADIEPGIVPTLSDTDLLALRLFGRGMLAEVRAVCPGPPLPVYAPCPSCGGTGHVAVEA